MFIFQKIVEFKITFESQNINRSKGKLKIYSTNYMPDTGPKFLEPRLINCKRTI